METEKQHVGLEQHVCMVCCEVFDTGTVLLDKRLKRTLKRHTVTGFGLCPAHEAMHEAGFIALVEIDPDQSDGFTPEGVHRLGRVVHVRRTVARKMFNAKVTDEDIESPVAWVPTGVVDLLERKASESAESEQEG